MPAFDLGAPQPVTSIVGSLLLDGSRPFGYQAANRTITLPVKITAPDFQTLIGAREVLLREINQQTWTLRWTRDTSGPLAGNTAPLPLLFDCFRAAASVNAWGGVDQHNRQPVGLITISFEALPYGRTDVPVVVDFPSPLSGRTAPPAAINIDTFSSVSGTQWAASGQSPVSAGFSAFWDPTISPAFNPQGTGLAATYTKGSLSLNLAAGWSALNNATGTTTTFIVSAATAVTAGIDIGDQFQLWTSAPALIQTQIFTVTKISPVISGGGNVTVTYTPASSGAPVSTNSAIQTGPPSLNAVTFWAGFGSTQFYQAWARLGGRVTFAVTLTDTYSTALSFSKTFKVAGSNSSGLPKWNKIRIPVPYQAGFDYANVASYSVVVTNRGSADLRYTQLYLSNLMAAPPPVVGAPSSARGTVYELAGLPGTARAPVSLQFQQSGTKAYVRQLTVQGANQQWVCPPGVSTVAVFAIGGGGSGAGNSGSQAGGGGGGGGSAANAAVAVTAGKAYSFTVGNGGFYTGGAGAAGTASSFTGDSVTVTANSGAGGTISSGGAGGTAGTGGFAGGAGGAGVASTNSGGGGGGASGGTGTLGGTGAAGSGANGGAGGTAVAGGGNGGKGGSHSTSTNGASPTTGYGGGGGGGPQPGRAGSGAGGLVQLTYTATLPVFQTLVCHRPPPDTPYALVPFVSPDPGDVPNGNIAYPVGSLVPGVPARFAGTYTVVVAAWAWNNPTAARTITVTVTQTEQPGGAAYSSSTAASVIPSSLPSCPGTNAVNGPLVVIGELTLPVQEMPQDNTAAYFTVSISDTNTSDQFMDILLLDTLGSTVMILSPTAYGNLYLDEPASDRDIGLILGSLFDRGDAVSVLDRAIVAGGPMSIDPDGSPLLLVYAAEGAPNAQMIYHPRWHLDRIS